LEVDVQKVCVGLNAERREAYHKSLVVTSGNVRTCVGARALRCGRCHNATLPGPGPMPTPKTRNCQFDIRHGPSSLNRVASKDTNVEGTQFLSI
jgi:hypothetical protein